MVVENIRNRKEDLAMYGFNEIEQLIEIFAVQKKESDKIFPAIVDATDIRVEWRLFKRFVINNYANQNNKQFWSLVLNNH